MNNFEKVYSEAKDQAERRAALLAQKLEKSGRTEEMIRAAADSGYLDQLYHEFNI